MTRAEQLRQYFYRDVHSYGSHNAVMEAKYGIIDTLASTYPRPLLQTLMVQELLNLAQLEFLIVEYRTSTQRQQRQQKLWQQRGLLERTKMNLRALITICPWEDECKDLSHAGLAVDALIRYNKQLMEDL